MAKSVSQELSRHFDHGPQAVIFRFFFISHLFFIGELIIVLSLLESFWSSKFLNFYQHMICGISYDIKTDLSVRVRSTLVFNFERALVWWKVKVQMRFGFSGVSPTVSDPLYFLCQYNFALHSNSSSRFQSSSLIFPIFSHLILLIIGFFDVNPRHFITHMTNSNSWVHQNLNIHLEKVKGCGKNSISKQTVL